MKKLAITLATVIIAAAASFSAHAEGFLVKGGFNYTHLDLTQSIKEQAQALAIDPRNYSGFHAGIGYQTESWSGFTLQPELLILSKKGNQFGDQDSWALNYIELPVNLQWGIDLVALRPFVQVSPYLGYSIRNKVSFSKDHLDNKKIVDFLRSFSENAGRFSYGVGVGGGIELMRRFQISAQYVWNFGEVANIPAASSTGSRDTAAALELSLALLF